MSAANQGEFQLLTSSGPAAIAVVGVYGAAGEFMQRHVRARGASRIADRPVGAVLRAELVDADGAVLDDILITIHAVGTAAESRLHLHGGPFLVRRCAELLRECGFVERPSVGGAWRGRSPLEEAAWALAPQMRTVAGARWLLQLPGLMRAALEQLIAIASLPNADLDEVRRKCQQIIARRCFVGWFVNPTRIALIGPPNAGKSTLANALADQAVSLVSPVPGTTRDWVEVPGDLCGFPVVWIDTAGLRQGADPLEAEGVARTQQIVAESQAVVVVLDVGALRSLESEAFLAQYRGICPAAVALNKIDVSTDSQDVYDHLPESWNAVSAPISALEHHRLDTLMAQVAKSTGRAEFDPSAPAAVTHDQVRYLEQAIDAIDDRERFCHIIGLIIAGP